MDWGAVIMALFYWYLPLVDGDDRAASVLIAAGLEAFDPTVWH